MVEWKKLGEICYISDYVSNGSFASLRENVKYKNEPDYAILVRFADFSNGFDKSKFVYIDEHAYNFLSKSFLEGGEIIMSNVGSCGLLFRCPVLDRKMSLAPNSILIKSDFIDYLYYWLGSDYGQEEIKKITSKSAMPKFNKTEFKKIPIPIPSLSEQSRIVGILDTFISSIENLKEQIKQRRKQYEHYRDQLLDLEGKPGVEIKTIAELGSFFGGLAGKSKNDFIDGNAKFITYMNVFSNPSLNTETVGSVKINEGEKQNKIQKGDILFTGSSETPEEAGMSCVVTDELEEDFYMNSFCFGLRLNSLSAYNLGYFKHIFRSTSVRTQISKSASGVTRFNISKERFKKVQIPTPSLDNQHRIVSILDTFEASISNLEAQLAQRQKQYEYYRNKLLTFE